jgi:hypothetical protein
MNLLAQILGITLTNIKHNLTKHKCNKSNIVDDMMSPQKSEHSGHLYLTFIFILKTLKNNI